VSNALYPPYDSEFERKNKTPETAADGQDALTKRRMTPPNDTLQQVYRDAVAELKADEKHFRAYFEHSLVGMAAILPDKGWLEANQAFCNMLGYSSEDLLSSNYDTLTHPDDLEDNTRLYQQLLDGSLAEYTIEKRLIHKSGDLIDVVIGVRGARTVDGSLAYAVLLAKDISQRKQIERSKRMRQQILEKVARGDALQDIMVQVIESVESMYPGSLCSIQLIDETGQHLLPVVAPSLPDVFMLPSDAIPVGLGEGSCGTAAFLGKRVAIADITSHPYWKNYKELTVKTGLRACWSEPILSATGTVLGSLAVFRKVSSLPEGHKLTLLEVAANLLGIAIERVRAEEDLQLASSIYTSISEAVLVFDANHNIIALNPAFTRINGYTLDDIRGKHGSFLYCDRYDADFFQMVWNEVAERGFWQGRIWSRHKNGSTFPKWLTINAMYNDEGEVENYVTTGSDITNKIKTDELIWRQANYDLLTNLPNRHMFQDRLEQEIRKVLREKRLLALLFLDLDHFKDVNDTFGHPMGDQLLVEAAARINSCVRETDTVARMGGDEFTVILPKLKTTINAEKVAKQIINALAEPFIINGEAIHIGTSIGIAFCPTDTTELDQLISHADQAMYASKAAGRNRLSYFTQALHDEAMNRLILLNDMRSAITNRQFELHFQPIIDLSSGRVYKAEALIRWHHPERGMISPADFIPLAEESGLIVEIGDWVFREAAAQTKRWNETFNCELQIAVNMSPVQFQSTALNISDWLAYLQTIELAEKYLSIEITEGLLLDANEDVRDKLLQLRDAGIEVAIDDFGMGYSALSSLRRFDIDYLKIDQFFIQNIETEPDNLALTEAIIIMAHKLGLKVIAEGVETEMQRCLLLGFNCNYAQGYHFSRPLPAAALEEYLANSMSLD